MAAPAFQPKQIVVYFISQRLCKRAQWKLAFRKRNPHHMMAQTRSNKFSFFLRFNLPDFNLQNWIVCSCPQDDLISLHHSDFKRGLSPALSLTNGKCIKNLMSHQIFNKKSDGFLLYFTSQRLHSLLLPASIPCNYSASLLKTLNRKALKYEIGFDSQWSLFRRAMKAAS